MCIQQASATQVSVVETAIADAVLLLNFLPRPFLSPSIELMESKFKARLDLVEATRQTPEELGMSDHFLYIGRKKKVL
ncbi:hypothetical protein [Synechocystis sp. PCC 7509]|uniref:hypothetical protein n=1 Tax=Synechocystis sp. PCC 7509 TaxID=927677 RepID=UPI0002ABE7E9|nr:hypothetical protein [Synechocystis sp. PCC 7509]